jgi:ABC-type multidrug transport system ATPase subunit
MSALLQVRNASRSFQTTLAVDDVSFDVQPGELLGLIGAERRRQEHAV